MKAGEVTTFTMKEDNPSSSPVPNTNISLQIFAGGSKSPSVKASQVQLSYSTNGPSGSFSAVPLSGSTADGNVITGTIGQQAGAPLSADASRRLTFHVTVVRGVRLSSTTPLLAIEAYLDQVNSASGTGASLADTYATNVTVATATAPSSGVATWLIALAAFIVLVMIGAYLLLRARRRSANAAAAPSAQA